jgi:hypothetical protein
MSGYMSWPILGVYCSRGMDDDMYGERGEDMETGEADDGTREVVDMYGYR